MVSYYHAVADQNNCNRNLFVGGTGGWSGRLRIAPSRTYNVIANANSTGPLCAALVSSANYTHDNQIATVSGLTYCIGVIVARENGVQQLGPVVVAHFNGGYDDAASWTAIAAGVGVGFGALHAIVIATSDTTEYGMMSPPSGIMQTFRAQLSAPAIAVPDGNQIFYWSNTSGVEFGLTRNGTIGEPKPKLHQF